MLTEKSARETEHPFLFIKLNERSVKYLVDGELAVNFHGVPGMTQDLDLLIELSEENILTVFSAKSLSTISGKPAKRQQPRSHC